MSRPTANPPAGASSSSRIASLEAEIERFETEQRDVLARIKALMAAEDPATGVFHAQEIFGLRQDKLRLDVELDTRRRQIKRILYFGEE